MLDQTYLDDFRNFLWLSWKSLGLPNPSVVQYDIADWLQHGPKRLQTQAMRGAGKSWMTAAFVVWCLARDPNLSILVISAGKLRAEEFVLLCRMIIETVPGLEYLAPGPNQRSSAFRFDVGPAAPDKDPSVAAYGITSMVVGTHVDVVILDDVETPDNALTDERRTRLEKRCLQFEMILNPGGRIVYLGTPQTIDSLYCRLESKYTLRRWPSEYPDPNNESACRNVSPLLLDIAMSGEVAVRKGRDCPGDSTYPEYYTNEHLQEEEATAGWSEYALQMLLDTDASDENKFPLKLSDWIVFDCQLKDMAPASITWGRTLPVEDIASVGINKDMFYNPIFFDPQWRPFVSTVMYIDPSGRGKDETAYAIGKYLNGMIYIIETGGFKGGYEPETMEALAERAEFHEVKMVALESNYGGGMFTELFKTELKRTNRSVGIKERHVTGQKELRIIKDMEPALNGHRLVASRQVAEDNILMSQLTRLTKDRNSLKHDDRLEAVSGVVWYFMDMMSIDPVAKAQHQAAQDKVKMVKDFIHTFKSNNGQELAIGRGGGVCIEKRRRRRKVRRRIRSW